MMWHDEYSRDVPARPEQVWTVLVDVERWPEWSTAGARHVQLLPNTATGGIGAGTRFRMSLPEDKALDVEIVTFTLRREFTDVAEVNGITVRTEHLLEPHDAGTRITYRAILTGDVPGDVLAETGAGAMARVPELIDALAERALSVRTDPRRHE